MRGRGGGRTRRGRGGSSCDRRCGVFASGDFVWEKSTPACVVVRQLWRGNKTCRLRVSRQLRCPKVSKGRAESPLVRPQAHTPCPGWGMTRRLRRGSRAYSPMGRSHFSFGGERKVCKRKPAARRLREKALYCPFLKEGVRNVARSMVKLPTFTFVRARAHSNPLSKRARLFPSAAYRRSAPAQLAVGILIPCRVGGFEVARWFCGAGKRTGFLFPVGVGSGLSPCGLGCFGVAWKFCGADE